MNQQFSTRKLPTTGDNIAYPKKVCKGFFHCSFINGVILFCKFKWMGCFL